MASRSAPCRHAPPGWRWLRYCCTVAVLLCVTLCAAVCASPASAQTLERVTLQLKWTHAFQFAGYYAAFEKGYYREAGLDVTIKAATPGLDVVQRVLAGAAEYGVGTSSLLLARHAGQPVVVLGVIFQHSPLVLVAKTPADQRGLRGVHDLAGKRVMVEPQSEELIAYLRLEGLTKDRYRLLPHSFNTQDFIDGKVEAMSAYVSNEPFYLDRAGVSYQILTPRSGGIDFYGDNLFTTETELAEHPERVAAFREASLRGWHYAMQHPQEVIEWIVTRYAPEQSRDFLRFEAERMVPLLRPDLIELGYMYRGRWQHIAQTYAELGLLPQTVSLDGFLYEPDRPRDYTAALVALGLLAVVSGIALYIHRINKRLSLALRASQTAEGQIRHLAQHDALTDLPNRALFADRLQQALLQARRSDERLAVLFIDLDRFKPVNDQLGHSMGDRLLQQVAQRLRREVRESDTVARVGGDEFVVLLRQLTADDAAEAVGRKLGARLAEPFDLVGNKVVISSSIGIALYPQHGQNEEQLLKCADHAMYQSKRDAKGQLRVYTAEID